MSPFSERLRAFRSKRQLRQKDAADLLGYEQSYLSALETGAKGPPRKEFLERLIKVYGLDEAEVRALANALSQSKRTLVLPKNASMDEFQLFNKLENQLGRLQQRQIDLINIALEMGECPPREQEEMIRKTEMEVSKM